MKAEFLEYKTLKYVIRYPDNYSDKQKYPVILFLHGAGTRGNNIELLKDAPFFKITGEIKDFPFITVAPLCQEETWFDMFERLKEFVLEIASWDFISNDRIYLMGTSMGGYGAWQLAMSMPEIFAAAIPICGGGMYWNAARLVNVPVWAFHGKLDTTVKVEESEKMVEAVNNCGGNARLTIYPENDHDAWTDTYSNPEVFNWLGKQKNSNVEKIVNIYKDSKIYG